MTSPHLYIKADKDGEKKPQRAIQIVIKTLQREGAKNALKWLSRYAVFRIFSPSLIARIKYGKRTVLKEIQDSKMYLNPLDSGIHSELLIFGVHEKKSTEILKRELAKGLKVIDIGANIGYYALIEGRIVGKDGKVYAIEPEPSNFELLNKNVKLNNLSDTIRTFQAAISDSDGQSYLFLGDRSNIHSMFEVSDAATLGRGKISVNTMTLTTFLNENSIADVDLIRMDVEGSEYRIIGGMQRILQEKSPMLFIEFHPNILKRANMSIVKLLKKLYSFGYTPKYVLTKRSERVLQPSKMELLRDDYVLEQPFHAFLEKKGG